MPAHDRIPEVIGVLLWFFSCLGANGAGNAIGAPRVPEQLQSAIPEFSDCRQVILVTTGSWDDMSATVQLYERGIGEKTSWRKVGKLFPAVVGQRGLGWGIGLHGWGEAGT
jgi:hypothetical protein